MKPCFGYIRVSTQKQGEGVSLDAQKDAILVFAEAHGFAVTEWFEEKETAAKSGRPIFNRMLRDLKRGKARGLIMHKIDRSARNLRDWAIISELPDIGVDVHIATEPYDFRSRGGRLTADIQAVIAADYIRNLREETIKGLTGRLKQGLYPFRAPIGYRDNGRGKPKTVCLEKGPLVRQAFDLYASGECSLRALQQEMARRGLAGHTGKPLSLHGIETMLGNPFYLGLIAIRRTGVTYQGIHEPLVDARTFKRVQDVRSGRAGKKVTRHNHLYQGLFRCGLCDRPMTPERQKGHIYYRCHARQCDTKTVRQELLDHAVRYRLEALRFLPEAEQQLRARFMEWFGGQGRVADITSLELRLAKAADRLDRLTDLLVDGDLDKHLFEEKKSRLTLERIALQEEINTAHKEDLLPDELEKFLELMKSLPELYELLVDDEKRSLIRNVFSNRSVSGQSVELKPHGWLADRQFADLSLLVTHVDTLIELSAQPANDNKPEIPQWRYNLQHQRPDDRAAA
ncbi:recombinase family protein [Mesorhizobium sp. 10J20-29]